MIELFLCSLFTILPDYSLPAVRARKAAWARDHALLGLVRTSLRHHGLPGADDRAADADPLLPPFDQERRILLQDGADPSRGLRTR